MMDRDALRGKVAVVTGGGAGIGLATARTLTENGAAVVVADLDPVAGQRAARDLTAAGYHAVGVEADVSVAHDVAKVFRVTMETFGGLDILCNNAGITIREQIADLDDTEWERLWVVNVGGVFQCSKQAIPLLRDRGGGVIINVGSVHSQATFARFAAYSATKAAVAALTRGLAVECGSDGIRVNCVCPGTIDSHPFEVLARLPGFPFRSPAERAAAQPIGRTGTPAEVAEAIVFLASPKASFITGACLMVDGGATARLLALGSQ